MLDKTIQKTENNLSQDVGWALPGKRKNIKDETWTRSIAVGSKWKNGVTH